jgi:hypothetical protein
LLGVAVFDDGLDLGAGVVGEAGFAPLDGAGDPTGAPLAAAVPPGGVFVAGGAVPAPVAAGAGSAMLAGSL